MLTVKEGEIDYGNDMSIVVVGYLGGEVDDSQQIMKVPLAQSDCVSRCIVERTKAARFVRSDHK